MPIIVKINNKAARELVTDDQHFAVLADIVDLGEVATKYGPKHKIQFVYITDENDSQGRAKYLFERFTPSFHEKAGLTKRVKQFLGVVPDEDYDVEQLIGTSVKVIVEHNVGEDGKTYANIASLKLDPKNTVKVPADFKRKKDRPQQNNVKAAGGGKAVAAAVLAKPTPISDEDIPF